MLYIVYIILGVLSSPYATNWLMQRKALNANRPAVYIFIGI